MTDEGKTATAITTNYDEYLARKLSDPRLAEIFEDAGARAEVVRDLVACRKSRGLTQQVVAEAMRTSQSHVSELEGLDGDPRLSTLQRYCRALGGRLSIVYTEPVSRHAAAEAVRSRTAYASRRETRYQQGSVSSAAALRTPNDIDVILVVGSPSS